jgi:hypothetical protein
LRHGQQDIVVIDAFRLVRLATAAPVARRKSRPAPEPQPTERSTGQRNAIKLGGATMAIERDPKVPQADEPAIHDIPRPKTDGSLTAETARNVKGGSQTNQGRNADGEFGDGFVKL